MNAQEFRNKLQAFLGAEEYQKLLAHFREKQRMRFYHEKQWHKFIEQYPQFRLSSEELPIALRVCQVHGDELQWGEAKVYQDRFDRLRNYFGARSKSFPHNGTAIVVQEESPVQIMPMQVWFCPSCRQASTEWEYQPRRGYVFPDLDREAQSYPISGVPADDLRAALEVVLNSPEVHDKRILSVRWHPDGYIKIKTGNFEGPLNGNGDSLTLRRRRDTWVIDSHGFWATL